MINKVPFNGAGYLDVGQIMAHVLPYTWIWGGRGTGKTYGFFFGHNSYYRKKRQLPYLYLG